MWLCKFSFFNVQFMFPRLTGTSSIIYFEVIIFFLLQCACLVMEVIRIEEESFM